MAISIVGTTKIIHMLGIRPFHAQSLPSQKRMLVEREREKERERGERDRERESERAREREREMREGERETDKEKVRPTERKRWRLRQRKEQERIERNSLPLSEMHLKKRERMKHTKR